MTSLSRTSVVVGIDGSASAVRAALWAAGEAARHHWPVRLVYAYFQPILSYPPLSTSTTANNMLLDQAHRDLRTAAAAVRTARPGVQVSAQLRYGHPVTLLLGESSRARLVVLGSRGQGGVVGLLLGSVAGAIAVHAECPVVVVPAEGTDPAAGEPRGDVVVGVDGSPVSEEAVAVAFDEASTRQAPLVAVHAWNELPLDGRSVLGDDFGEPHRIEEHERAVLAERLAGWQEKYPDVAVTKVVTMDRPSASLLEHARRAQLLVVGSRGRGGFAGMLLGSTSRTLLHHAPCPVIVARPVRHRR